MKLGIESGVPLRFVKQPIAWLKAFWKFSRPHTIIGTSLSVLALYLIAISESGYSPLPPISAALSPLRSSFFPTLLACLCGNVYIVGLNQLEDVEIDRINKPRLPLASGEFSRRQGVMIVVAMGILAIAIAALQSPYLLTMVGISLLIGTVYSLPPIRLKRFPFWASLCIFTVRGIVVNLGLFLHFDSLLLSPFAIPPSVWALTAFVLVFTFAIAIFKDVPDMEGDRQYNISTFTLKLGQQKVFNLARWVITASYIGMVLAGFARLPGVHIFFLISTHLMLLGILWLRSVQVDLHDKGSISRFYQFIWKLFFLEYLLFPIACLIAPLA
ncbi:homogentisate phytyltransferase [Phormidium sp. CLA17]|uniref:homogentisate phytyltransferase n=1 Tax=Leptolyngbya sp. Cla-17 TaxID=2803751 RepID=UPI00149207F6|nr:homogentisate phytyltransferase [Leptolyngbya sp. Cla-17]MBM0743904.1 homogentisate phytyltransferase [Leptolyngbya sp. Cla-17]